MEPNKITSKESKTFNEDQNFYFDGLSGRPFWDLRKMLGRQLFKARQECNRPLQTVSVETRIPVEKIDKIEIGYEKLRWQEISHLLDYYNKKVKLTLVTSYGKDNGLQNENLGEN